MGLFGFGKHNDEYNSIYSDSDRTGNCPYCNTEIRWKDGQYICPNCGEVMSRSEFFNAIGAEPPGPECVDCNNLYPGCIICLYGYVKE